VRADAWTALGTWVTAIAALGTMGIAIIAALVARRQLREAKTNRMQTRQLQDEQGRPYVVAFMDAVAHNPQFIDLVIRNYGRTAAFDVRTQITPTPQESPASSGNPVADIPIPDCISLLAPSQEWRTLWDFGPARQDAQLPDLHTGTIKYADFKGNPLSTPVRLDFSTQRGRRWVGEPRST